MKTVIRQLLHFEDYGVDENGFLYKRQSGGVYRPLRPRITRYGNERKFYFEITVEIKGKKETIHFFQENLRAAQGNAIGRIVNERRN